MNILALDQGTSGTKALVVHPRDGVLGSAEIAVHPRYLGDGAVEQDPRELLSSLLLAGRRAIARAGCRVDAVALANQGETVLAWDPDSGVPLSAAIVWQDRRAQSVCARLADHAGELARRTGLQLDPYFSAPKMAWLRENVTRDGVVTTSDTWLLYQLTGEFVTDAATASRSLVLDLDTVTWADDLLGWFGLDGERLPRIVAGDEVIGTTRAFGAEIPVGGLVVDQPAALVAQHCLEPGTAKCTFGTGAFLLANTGDKPARSAAGLTSSVAWSARDTTTYCLDGQVYTAASAVRWLRELGLIEEAADLDRVAATESEGVLCVPSLAGLAAPWWEPAATATFTGLSLGSGRGHLVLALLEGIAAEVAELGRLVAQDLEQPLRRLRVDGGLTRSARLMQAQADLLQVPVDVFPSANATALGAAALARLALEPSLTLDEAVGAWQPEATYTPRWPAERAQEHLQRWRDVAEFTARNGKP